MSDTTSKNSLNSIVSRVDVAMSTVSQLRAELRKYEASDCLPREPAEPETSLLSALGNLLEEVKDQARGLDYRLIGEPIERLLSGLRLSSAQFYSLRSIGVDFSLEAVLSAGDGLNEYEAYSLIHYGGHEAGLIDPARYVGAPNAERTGAHLSIAPEQVRISELRPDQHQFLRDRMPEVFARFKP